MAPAPAFGFEQSVISGFKKIAFAPKLFKTEGTFQCSELKK